ncbi:MULTISPECIES: cytochrome c [Thalassospira]|jgi:hypothetical protein|nr:MULTISPECIES: cytochrome c [Thalassospira]MBL4842671.1 cytochrome c [Thalassospira sp.]MBR9780547.1 cytochrome c [Rhodospirillales bacterium]OCK07184.1 cytochrome c class II [Thalassospira sp. KO164]QPL35893.1 cytochrome c [Thalassospira sp. B30-1]SED98932.1 Cytochrome C' [Thalassospira permensis]|tara:strand:- start:3759 stop:3905 length:147 start_codon:yes stop_codon:yes gene_type:complete
MTDKISRHAGSAFTELFPSGSDDAGQFNDAFRNVLQTCKSCHQQFRAD